MCKVAELLPDFSETFSKNEDDLRCTNLTSHVTDTGHARPVKQAPRWTPSAFEGRDREALEKNVEQGDYQGIYIALGFTSCPCS